MLVPVLERPPPRQTGEAHAMLQRLRDGPDVFLPSRSLPSSPERIDLEVPEAQDGDAKRSIDQASSNEVPSDVATDLGSYRLQALQALCSANQRCQPTTLRISVTRVEGKPGNLDQRQTVTMTGQVPRTLQRGSSH